jgi:integrase/recombinase XerD
VPDDHCRPRPHPACLHRLRTTGPRRVPGGYRGLTREAYALDLRQFTSWCRTRSLALFAVRRADIEGFARELEARGRARATVTRRLSTIAGFYKYAVEEELLDHSPAAHVRRPRVDYESHATALDRNELGALLVAAGLGLPGEHALISLLALNGLRVSEAAGADIGHLGLERGHRTLTITRKGGKVVTIPLAPRTARAMDLAVGERTDGPVFLAGDGRRLDRHGAGRIVRKTARRAGITKPVTPHTLRHAFITAVGCRGPVARRAGSRLPRGPEDHDAIRPGPRQPGPARHIYCRRLRRRRRPIACAGGQQFRLAASTVRRTAAKSLRTSSGNTAQPSPRARTAVRYAADDDSPAGCGHPEPAVLARRHWSGSECCVASESALDRFRLV